MKNLSIKQYATNHKKVIVSTPLILLLGWWAYTSFIQTFPLGDKLGYFDKRTNICLEGCRTMISSTYYYRTDLTEAEIVKYFHATTNPSHPVNSEAGFISLALPNGTTAEIQINKGRSYDSVTHLGSADKPVLEVYEWDYANLADALKKAN